MFGGLIRYSLSRIPIGLFIICNKTNTEDEFRNAFDRFGKIEEIYTIKDRATGDNKGMPNECLCVCVRECLHVHHDRAIFSLRYFVCVCTM